MAHLNRRQWLQRASLASSFALFGGIPQLTAAEKIKFNPRPFASPVRLSSNENPYGPSKKVRDAISDAFDLACRYPFSYSEELIDMIAKKEGVTPEHIIVTAGSTEGLKITGITYGIDGGEIIAGQPTFLAMMNYAEQWGASINWVPVDKDLKYDLKEIDNRISAKTKLIFLCNPNNPTSTLLPGNEVRDFCESVSNKCIVFSDEAYYDFIEQSDYPSMVELVKQEKDVIVSRTFSKVYGLAGIRIGYLVAKPSIASKLRKNVVAFTNTLALEAAKTALEDKEFYEFSLKQNKQAKNMICSTLDEIGLEYVKSHTNFIFFKSGRNIKTLQKQMLDQGVIIGRPFPPFTDWCRISTGTMEEVQMFNKGIRNVMS